MPVSVVRVRFTLVILVTILSMAAVRAEAQGRRAMTPVDLLEVPRVLDPQLSPDGSQVLYVLERPDWKANRRIGHIWRIDAGGANAVQLTFGERGEQSPRWSPDGARIAFLARRGEAEETQVYLLANDGGEARPLTQHPSAVSSIQWAPDGASIYFLAHDAKTAEEKKRDELKDDVFAFDEDYKQRHLWTVRVADGTTTRVTEGAFSVLNYRLSADGRRVAHHRSHTPLLDNSDEGEVWLMDADGKDARQLTRNTVAETGAELSPDGTHVLFVSGASAGFETYYNDNLFVVPAGGGTARALTADLPHEINAASWSADGKAIYLVAGVGVRSELFQLDPASGAVRRLTRGDHSLQGWRYVREANRHVFQLDEATRYGEVWTLPAAGSATPSQVTHMYDTLAAEFALPRQEAIRWKGADGVEVEGLLFYPIEYTAGRRYPLVVQTHGGPASADRFGFQSWSNYVPVLTAMGYAVLKPNYRGSTGYGDAFLRDMVGHYFHQAHLDVMAGVDDLIARGIADPDRLAKMGWSAGGHMTNKIITFTSRFKAASSGAGAANWISMYAQSDQRHYRTPWFGGTPWQEGAPIEQYWNDSPLKDVAKVKTPTIFLVGVEDPRVPAAQSIEMHQALKHNGVPTRLYLAPREPHGWTELRHQLFKINVELEWFETHVTKRPYTWTVAPGDPPRAGERKTTS